VVSRPVPVCKRIMSPSILKNCQCLTLPANAARFPARRASSGKRRLPVPSALTQNAQDLKSLSATNGTGAVSQPQRLVVSYARCTSVSGVDVVVYERHVVWVWLGLTHRGMSCAIKRR
jgi:hypothetical protein